MNDQHINDEVAKLTDAVLNNQMIQASDESQAYEPLIHELKALIEPEMNAPDALRERLAQRLRDEWTISRRPPQPRLFSSRTMRIATLAASVAVVLLVVILLYSNGESTTPPVSPGSSFEGPAIFAIVALVGGIIAFALLRGKR